MKEQVIHLEPHDDVISVRDKLGWIQAGRVLLVIPDVPDQPVLRETLDLVLLQREATRQHSDLALITRDPIVVERATDLGIACFSTIESSHRRFWKSARARLRANRADQPNPFDADLAETGVQRKAEERKQAGLLSVRFKRGLFRGAAVALVGGALAILPGATIHISPVRNQSAVSVLVVADPRATAIDLSASIIPARLVEEKVRASATIETTGVADIPSTKARGQAVFTNLVPDQLTIPAGTIVQDSAASPTRFVTLIDVTMPAKVGQIAVVDIEAIEPGTEGNLPRNRINETEGSLGTQVAVTNPEPTQGGDVDSTRAVSQADLGRVRALVIQQLQQRAFLEMRTDPFVHLVDTEFIPPESLVVSLIDTETSSGSVGRPGDSISLDMQATVQGMAIDERAARQVVYARLIDRVGPGNHIGAGSLRFTRGETKGIDELRRLTFLMQGASDVFPVIRLEDVRVMVAGRPIGEARDLMKAKLPLARPPSISLWPEFWPLMPLIPLRIDVAIEGAS